MNDIWLLNGVRTQFAGYNGALAAVSSIDLSIKAVFAAFTKNGASPQDVRNVIAGSMAQGKLRRLNVAALYRALIRCARANARTSGATRLRNWR